MKMRPFEMGILIGFGVLLVVGLIVVSNFKGGGNDVADLIGPRVTIWGTVPDNAFNNVMREFKDTQEEYRVVEYTYIDERFFDDQLVNAIAEGRGPDIVFMPHTKLVDHLPKLSITSYESFPARQFLDKYIDGAEIYMLPSGIAGFPVAIDPLVMYWNRDILTSNGFAAAPSTWEEVVNRIVPDIVSRDFNRNILLSPIALGEYQNIKNAEIIISALMLQGGSVMVTANQDSSGFNIQLDVSESGVANPATNAIEFFTSFSTVNNPLYSWNRAQPEDISMFGSGDVALYFGRGSEYQDIARLNPNLNFDIADFPQSASARTKRTYGDVYAFSVLKAAPNPTGASLVLSAFGLSDYYASKLATELAFAPASRAALSAGTNNPVDRVRYNSALYARGWYNPQIEGTEAVFKEMIESVLANRNNAKGAVADAVTRLRQEF